MNNNKKQINVSAILLEMSEVRDAVQHELNLEETDDQFLDEVILEFEYVDNSA